MKMIMVLVGIISPEVGIIYYWRGQEHNWANLGEAKLKARCHTRFMVWSTLLTLYTACLHHTPHTGKGEGYAGARERQKWKKTFRIHNYSIIIKWLLYIAWYYSCTITSFGVYNLADLHYLSLIQVRPGCEAGLQRLHSVQLFLQSSCGGTPAVIGSDSAATLLHTCSSKGQYNTK